VSALSVRDCAERRNALKQKPDPSLPEEIYLILRINSSLKLLQTWERGRPVSVDNKHTTDYRYDANGERICKYSDLGETIYASGYYTETDGKKISKHIYIGSTRVASQVMSRSCETSTTMKRENTLYYHTDHLGSSGYVTDKKGEFYEHTEYTSSGESWVNEKVTGNANLPFKYTSKEQDAETGLYYYGARYYDARTSRWISTDPILEKYLPTGNKEKDENLTAGGVFNSYNLNMYHYAGNNPVVMIDPNGKYVVARNKGRKYFDVKWKKGDIRCFQDIIGYLPGGSVANYLSYDEELGSNYDVYYDSEFSKFPVIDFLCELLMKSNKVSEGISRTFDLISKGKTFYDQLSNEVKDAIRYTVMSRGGFFLGTGKSIFASENPEVVKDLMEKLDGEIKFYTENIYGTKDDPGFYDWCNDVRRKFTQSEINYTNIQKGEYKLYDDGK